MKAFKPEPIELIEYKLGQALSKKEIKEVSKTLNSEHTKTYPIKKRITPREIALTIEIVLTF